jgi:hypothetical protein
VGAEPVDVDLEAWDAWHPSTIAAMLDGIDVPWCVVGGWALELHGAVSRDHGDVEITIPRSRFYAVRARLDGYELFVAGDGKLWPADEADESLWAMHHQTWVRDPDAGVFRLDVMREPHDGDTWICRRDANIRLPYADVIARTSDGIPYLRPEFVLLFKAKGVRKKDEADLAAVAPTLDADARSWLADAIARVYGADHAWLAALA